MAVAVRSSKNAFNPTKRVKNINSSLDTRVVGADAPPTYFEVCIIYRCLKKERLSLLRELFNTKYWSVQWNSVVPALLFNLFFWDCFIACTSK